MTTSTARHSMPRCTLSTTKRRGHERKSSNASARTALVNGLSPDSCTVPKPDPVRSAAISYVRDSSDRCPAVLERSRFAYLLQKGDVYCLFHALTLRMVYGGQILKEFFVKFEKAAPVEQTIKRYSVKRSSASVKQVFDDLWKNRLLVKGPDEDARLFQRLYYEGVNQSDVQHMYLLPTSACNFRCRYCFVEDDQRDLAPHYMTKATAKAALTVFARLSKNALSPKMTIYGGEPLLNPHVTFFAMRFFRRLEAEHKFLHKGSISLLTNGSLVDAEVVRIIKETQTSVSVSIDGPQKLHDAARKNIRGRGTFAEALHGYKRLQDAGLSPGISCTLNGFTIKHIDEIVDFIISDLKPNGMGFNLLLPRTGNENKCSNLDHKFAVQQLINAFERLREEGIYEDRMMRRIRPFVTQIPHFKDCMGVGGQIVVVPTGRVGPCQAYLGVEENKYFPLNVKQLAAKGDLISSENIYSEPLFDEWRYRFPFNMRQCADCFAISVCGGGCPYAAEVTHGSIWEIDDRICHQAKNILEWMIWDTQKHMRSEIQNEAMVPKKVL